MKYLFESQVLWKRSSKHCAHRLTVASINPNTEYYFGCVSNDPVCQFFFVHQSIFTSGASSSNLTIS